MIDSIWVARALPDLKQSQSFWNVERKAGLSTTVAATTLARDDNFFSFDDGGFALRQLLNLGS
jgi:hypothetical protein